MKTKVASKVYYIKHQADNKSKIKIMMKLKGILYNKLERKMPNSKI